jgi:Predicted ATP-dependent serine protease
MPGFTDVEKRILKKYELNLELSRSLNSIREVMESIWAHEAPRIVKDYTDHGEEHSQRIAYFAEKLLQINPDVNFSQNEIYLLLAGIYLHDIGMQCDIAKYPEIKTKAESLGAAFSINFISKTTDGYSLEEQKEIRKNHHFLSAAWIDYLYEGKDPVLSYGIRSIPFDLVDDLMDVCKFHSKLSINDCPISFKVYPSSRKRMVAALLRFADELDISSTRVNIETVKIFHIDPENSVYWWLHNHTEVNFVDLNKVLLRVGLNPEDFELYGSFIQKNYLEDFKNKNKLVLDVLVEERIPIVISSQSEVVSNKHVEKFPAEMTAVLDKKRIVESTFEKEGISNVLKERKLDEASIKAEIDNKYSEIAQISSDKIEKLENLKREKDELEYAIKKEHPLLYRVNNLKSFKAILLALIFIIIAFYLYYIFFNLSTTSIFSKYLQLSEVGVFVFIFFVTILGFGLLFSHPKYKEKKDKVKTISDSIKQYKDILEEEISNEGILPEIKSSINKQFSPSYENELVLSSIDMELNGYNPKYEIPTKSKEKLDRFLNGVSSGSIGISGPRGVGKSTLISSFCTKKIENTNGNVLSLITCAPVDYEPRDFLLHLFSLVCKEVLYLDRKQSKDYIDKENFDFLKDFQNSNSSSKNDIIRTLVSIFFIFIGLFFFEKTTYTKNFPLMTIPLLQHPPYLILSFMFLYIALLFYNYPRIIKYLSFKHYINGKEDEDVITKLAKEKLQMIKFQSSFSSGWSGELNVPFGYKGGIKSATVLSQYQLSLPEIVADYREFIEFISSKYKIIIGIDELDKISSNDKAYRFLNEIKGIFDIRNCYYLVSVSENAMSNFNKRGMPFRDAFDSSFDDIINVDYFNFESSKKLIERRVIGMPVPFMCLCYLMSGGLARDLIRVCRDLIDILELNPNNNTLSFLSKNLIKKEIMLKINSIKVDVKEINPQYDNFIYQIIEEIYQLEKSLEADSSLKKCCSNLMSFPKKSFLSRNYDDYQNKDKSKSLFLIMQIGIYLYYVLTIMEFFEKKIEKSSFKKDENSGKFDELAKAQHFLGFSPELAKKIITDFRKEHGMENI